MPGGMNGVDLANEIRRRWPNLPVVLTSGYSEMLAEGRGSDYELLRKPYSVEALSGLITEGHVEPTAAKKQPAATAGG